MWILDDCRLERDHGQCEPEALWRVHKDKKRAQEDGKVD